MALTPEWIASQQDYADQLSKAGDKTSRIKALRHRARTALAKYIYQTAEPAPFLHDAVSKADSMLDMLDELS